MRRKGQHEAESSGGGDGGRQAGRRGSSGDVQRAIRFLVIFALVSGAGVLLEYGLMSRNGATGYRALVAQSAHYLPRWLGISVDVRGSQLSIQGRILEVTPECSGIEAISIFLAGVAAVPCSRRKRLVGLLLGVIGVGLLNVARVSALGIVAGWMPQAFEPWHTALMHMFPLFAVLPLWLIWLMGRGGLVLQFLIYLAGTSGAWGLSSGFLAEGSLAAAKLAQRAIGAPTPFLLLDDLRFWWLAPPVQLFVSLTLISEWVSLRRRWSALVIGVGCLWFVVVMDVLAQSSPYVGPYEGRYVLGDLLTKGHLVITPVLFWLILVPLPVKRRGGAGGEPANDAGTTTAAVPGGKPEDRTRSSSRRKVAVSPRAGKDQLRRLTAALLCLSFPVVLWVLTRMGPEDVHVARGAAISAIRAWEGGGPIGPAVQAALRLGSVQEKSTRLRDRNVQYFSGRLVLEDAMGESDSKMREVKLGLARKLLLDASMNPPARRAIQERLNRAQ